MSRPILLEGLDGVHTGPICRRDTVTGTEVAGNANASWVAINVDA